MKIAVVHSFYSSASPSGENSVVIEQREALERAGHEVSLIAQRTDDLALGKGYHLSAALAAAHLVGPSPDAILTEFNPDIVHLHNLFPNWGTSWIRKWGPRLVATMHNYRAVCASGLLWRDGHDCELCPTGSSLNGLVRRCYRGSAAATLPLAVATRGQARHNPIFKYASSIVALNASAASKFTKYFPNSSISTIPNFAGDHMVGRSPKNRSGFSYVGRLTPEKGVQWLLKNWDRKHELQIAGVGPLADLVAEYARSEPATFKYLGLLPPEQARDLIMSSIGIVIPSLWSEGIPTVALEALQSGTPVLVSAYCASGPDIVRNGAGEVFSIDKEGNSLKSKVEAMIANTEMSSLARRQYEANFSQDAWLAKMQKVYSEVSMPRNM